VAVLISSTVLCVVGVLTKTEVMPILGGAIVVAHRLLTSAVDQKRNRDSVRPPKSTKGPDQTGLVPVVGMLAGSLLAGSGLLF